MAAYQVPVAIWVAVTKTCGLSGWSRRISSRQRISDEEASVIGQTS